MAVLSASMAAVAFEDFGVREHLAGRIPETSGSVRTLALQLDGSALIGTSTGALLRYLSDGTPDGSLAAVSAATSGGGAVTGVAALPDGRLIVAVSGADSYILLRLQGDGRVDAGFAATGAVTGHPLRIDALAVLGDGAIVVSGQERVPLDDGGERWNYIAIRHHPDGAVDGSFGEDGVSRLDLDNREPSVVSAAPHPGGGIVIASSLRADDGGSDIIVARLAAGGAPDPNFGDGARGTMRFGEDEMDERAAAVLIQPDGAIIVAGTGVSTESGVSSAMLLRLRADGALDPGFADSGALRPGGPDESACSAAHALAQLPDQTLLVAGAWRQSCGIDDDFLLLAVTPEGRVQAQRTLDLGGDEAARALAVQPNGRVLLAGDRAGAVELVRYALGDPPPLWDLEPDAFQFGNANGAQGLRMLVSEFRAVEEFDAGIYVPLRVTGGEYALNGSSQYTSAPGWVQLGDEISVRHVANARPQESETTRLTVGGIQAANNLSASLGAAAVLEFTSVTGSIPDDAGGGGALDSLALGMLGLLASMLCARRRRRGADGREPG